MKFHKIKHVVVVSALVLLTGCITDGNRYTWVNNSAGNVEQERAIADSECLAQAYKTFTANPPPSNNCVGACINNNKGILSGYLAGAAARQNREIREARERFYESCMVGKGWRKCSDASCHVGDIDD